MKVHGMLAKSTNHISPTNKKTKFSQFSKRCIMLDLFLTLRESVMRNGVTWDQSSVKFKNFSKVKNL